MTVQGWSGEGDGCEGDGVAEGCGANIDLTDRTPRGTKIAANASIDANRHRDWLVREVNTLLDAAAQVDDAEDAAHDRDGDKDDDRGDGQRVPASLRDRSGRAARLRAALAEITAREHAEAQARQDRHASAVARLERAQAGESVVGRIPRGPHRLAEARAHWERAVARQQAKLDRRAALIAAGRRPMGLWGARTRAWAADQR